MKGYGKGSGKGKGKKLSNAGSTGTINRVPASQARADSTKKVTSKHPYPGGLA